MAKRETKVEGVKALPELEDGFKKVKDLFKAGAVPREADYVMLIEYVHYLHKLLGVDGEEGSSGPGLGVGFIKAEGSALGVDIDGLAGAGLTGANSVFNVGAGNGIIVGDNTVSLDTVTVAGYGLSGAGGAFNIGAGAGITIAEDSVILDAVNVAGSGLTGSSGKISVGQGLGITVGADTVSLNAGTAAGDGLTGEDGKISVGPGVGITVDANTVSLATDSWKYIFAKLYQATHWAGDNAVSVFFTRMSLTHVVVRGIATGSYVFGPYMSAFTWQGVAPLVEYSSLDRGHFTFVYLDGDNINGDFDVWLTRGGNTLHWNFTISEL